MYLLDTDALSTARRLPAEHAVRIWLAANTSVTSISIITAMEIERGIEKQRRVDPPFAATLEHWLEDNLVNFGDRALPLTANIARRWGQMQIQLGRADNDVPIAATALEHGLTVVTRNVSHFGKTGATVFNPFDAP